MKTTIKFIATIGIIITVLTVTGYEINDIRHYIPMVIVAILLVIRDKTE